MSRAFLEELNRQRDRRNRGALDCVQTFFRQEPGVNNNCGGWTREICASFRLTR